MSKSHLVTLRIPTDLKMRLQREANYQGVSLKQLANYLLNVQITQLEVISSFESRLERKLISGFKKKVHNSLAGSAQASCLQS